MPNTSSSTRTRARIGLYSMGLKAYWPQFPGLLERLLTYGRFIEQKLAPFAEVHYFGMVDCREAGEEAGAWFQSQDVDIILCHSATYCTSASVLPVHQICRKPVVILNLQPTARIDYEHTTTGEWLANCGACPTPELANAFHRTRIPFRIVNGLLGLESSSDGAMADERTSHRPESIRAWQEIEEWVKAATVVRQLRHSRFGFLGNTYSGMLDLYSDVTQLQSELGIHTEMIEMCDLDRHLQTITPTEVAQKRAQALEMFEVSGDSPADEIAKRPTDEQLDWASKVAAAQEKLVDEFRLDGLTYYYHGAPGNPYEALQAGGILGYSLLTAQGVPCAGEGDLKTAIAMKICDILGVGGSFSEIVVVDYVDETILLGHDGPFHIAISDGKPILRGMGLYHGKQGTGISVEAKVRTGPVTTLNVTQTVDGRVKFITSEAESTDGPIMHIGNTQTAVRFREHPDTYMARWFAEAPTHHCALSVGHNASVLNKVADLLGIPCVRL